MKKNWVNPATSLLTIVIAIAAAGPELNTIDSNNRYFAYGLGQRTC